jgi:hypothetical protein
MAKRSAVTAPRKPPKKRSAPAKPSAAPTDKYAEKRVREAERQRDQSSKVRDIAPLPAVKNPKRRAAAVKSFRKFCETYFPNRFNMKWSPDHLEVLAEIQRIITKVSVLAVAMPRGSGKTSLAECAVLWAILCFGHKFVMLIAATKGKAKDLLLSVRTEIEYNDLLFEDFPEVCYPIRKLEGVNQRKPLFNGQQIFVKVQKTEIIIPQLPGTAHKGAIIRCAGLLGGEIRGSSYVLPDGERLRPSFFVADDPQTDGSAKSEKQSEERERILAGAVLGMAGPGKSIAGIVPCTVIRSGDMADRILNRELHPEYNGRRYRLLTRMPADKDLEAWRRYGEVRADGLRAGDEGAAGNAYYKIHRKEIEANTSAAWEQRFLKGELSAIQHAINLWLKDRRAFYAEYQNDPAAAEEVDYRRLDPNVLIKRTSGHRRGVVPVAAQYLAAGIDCHDDLLYWTVLALEANYTAAVIDYGTWPEQRSRYFLKREASPDIEKALFDRDRLERDNKARLYAALETLVELLLGREFPREPDGSARLGKIVLDAGYLGDTVFQFCKESKHAGLLFPSFGAVQGMPNKNSRPKNGARWGDDYYVPPPGRRPVRHALVDSNAWISKTHAAFLAPKGATGAWLLFDDDPSAHRCFADHICAELPQDLIDAKTGEKIRRWKLKPNADNHWLDATKLAGVGGFELGCRRVFSDQAGVPQSKSKRAPRVSYH